MEMIEKVAMALSDSAEAAWNEHKIRDDWRSLARAAITAYNPNERLREALERADKAMTCDEDEDSAHYCPNCDCSIFDAREAVRAALSHKEGSKHG